MLALVWTMVFALSATASIVSLRHEADAIAQNIARAYIDKDILYRNWNALHGGVYVPLDQGLVPSSHYPATMQEREVTTPSGRVLTFVNPAYMMRQIYELASKQKNISGHLTSLKPLWPQNAPSVWEAQALQAFERGETEASSEVREGGRSYLLLMRPLITDESCLKCHAGQGYRKGDVRGSISIKLPLELVQPGLRQHYILVLAAHGGVWLLGLGGLYGGYRDLRRRTIERDLALEELTRVNTLLEDQATVDPVTGTFNRRKFRELLQARLAEFSRYRIPMVLVFFDVDHFKSINDNYGHEIGDAVLVQLAQVVSGMIRKTDAVARYGGEEFVILLNHNDVERVRNLVERIRCLVEDHPFPRVGRVTCSFGITQFQPGDTEETVIRRADQAMYAAKHSGRNRVEVS
ncbi:diguanylate cyclase [Geomonas propionica]|uniref:diguanylate cyclase n=1 Tax=Geomonas propionica TaxID=2798582 RepID=A0ABS0YPF8_9BACT|nr:diguanylate cyclase [Geomonas propionica]MBJ6799861.1 diguanylate cyclase [Geomonas propionica]